VCALSHLDVEGGDVSLHVPLGLHLLVQLVLQAVLVVLRLPQLGGELELLPGLLSQELLMNTQRGGQR
jgi:hypothetical protein